MTRRLGLKIVAAIALLLFPLLLSACGGSSTDGGWLAHGSPSEVYFLNISGGTGTVDYASNIAGRGINRFHGTLIIHDDNTIEVDGMQDGELYGCSACPYQMTNGNLVINYTFDSYSTGQPVSGTMTFSQSDPTSYDNAVQTLPASSQ